MKKSYITPACDLILLADEDVITTSYNGQDIDADNGDGVDLPSVKN